MNLRCLALVLLCGTAALAESGDKRTATPAFYQCDPEAGFKNGGKDYCAAAALSDSLIYLTDNRGLDDLVKATGHSGQIKLIKKLAKAMKLDPLLGTSPDNILNGLRDYAHKRGYRYSKLEIASWRPLGKLNARSLVGETPELAWLQENANDPDTGVLLNVGWYYPKSQGWVRNGGHWVDVVGAEDSKLFIRNSLLESKRQHTHRSVQVLPIGSEAAIFHSTKGPRVETPGLVRLDGPAMHYNKVWAVVDAVIVFKLEAEE